MSSALRIGRNLLQPFITAGSAYNNVAKRYPMLTGVITTVVKTSAADLFAQKVIERREAVDWKRNGLFTFFGFAYLGCFQFWLYNDVFVRLCRPITATFGHYGAAPIKTFIDQCIHHPLVYFPTFYVLKGTVEGRPLSSSFTKYQDDLWENCKALWTVWVPAQLVNFAFVPLHLRIPFVAGVSFAWTVIISVMRGSLAHEDPAEVPVKEMHTIPPEALQHTEGDIASTPASSMPGPAPSTSPLSQLQAAGSSSFSAASALASGLGSAAGHTVEHVVPMLHAMAHGGDGEGSGSPLQPQGVVE